MFLLILGTNAFTWSLSRNTVIYNGINYTGHQAAAIEDFINANALPDPIPPNAQTTLLEIDILESSGFNPSTNEFLVDFEETTDPSLDEYVLYGSEKGRPFDVYPEDWEQVLVPRMIDVPHPGASRFRVSIDPSDTRGFFMVAAVPDD